MLIKMPVTPDLLLEAIYEHIEEEAAKEAPRPYIGASSIGDDCELKLWLYNRYPQHAKKKGAELILAGNDGHYSEDLTAEYIRKVKYKLPDIEIITRNSDGKQFGFSDLGGAYQGHWDGMILGLPAAPKTWHVWEHKAKNSDFYEKLSKIKQNTDEKEVLKEWNYLYYCQAVAYMEYASATRHYMTISTSGTRKFQSIRTDANPQLARNLREKAARIAKYSSPPVGLSENPSFYKCKMCDFNEKCPSINKHVIL